MKLLRKSTIVLAMILCLNSNAYMQSNLKDPYPRDFIFSFFERYYEEKSLSNDFVIVHLKNSKLEKLIYKSTNSNTSKLTPGANIDTFFNHNTEFPLGDSSEMIAILYQGDDGFFERKDDGHDSDSYVYDDRLIFNRNNYYPLYGSDIFPGIKTLNQKQIEQVINGDLGSKPSAVRCGNSMNELESKVLINNQVILDSNYLGSGEEVIVKYNKINKEIIFTYKLRGDDPNFGYFDLPQADDIGYEDGYYYGEVSISFNPYRWKTIQFPQDLLFKDIDQTSERFKVALTPLYYGFMNPRVCSFERSVF